jgi:hypothetical protein
MRSKVFCSNLFTAVFEPHSSLQKLRSLSAQASNATKTNFQDEWTVAKTYDSIPSLSNFQALRYFSPGGELKIHIDDKRNENWFQASITVNS